MRKRDQINCGYISFNPNVGTLFDRFDQTGNDGLTRGIANMKNPSTRVGGLLSPDWIAFFIVIENDMSSSFKYFVE